MNNIDFSSYLRKGYLEDNLSLLLECWVDEKIQRADGRYFSQEVYYKDYSFCDIQTWDEIDEEIIAHTPYCQRTTYWDGYMITVPKFGELTDEDISKAIGYVLRCIERESISFFTLYNTYLDGVHIKVNWFDDYKYVEDMLRDKKLRTRAIKTKEKDV